MARETEYGGVSAEDVATFKRWVQKAETPHQEDQWAELERLARAWLAITPDNPSRGGGECRAFERAANPATILHLITAARQGGGEPVAWQARVVGTDEWFTAHPDHAAFFRGSDAYETRPLYAAPSLPGDDGRARD